MIVSLLLRILPPLLDPEVEIECQHRLLLLVEVLVVADLVVLHLIKLVQRRLPERPLDLRHELVLVLHDLEQHFFDVLFDCKKVGLDAFLLEEFDLLEHGACRLIPGGVGPRDEAGNLLRELLKERAKNEAHDLIGRLVLLLLQLLLVHVNHVEQWLLAAVAEDVWRAL